MGKKLKKYTLDQVKDKHLGKKGTGKRDLYEYELQIEVIGDLIKQVRQERNLT